MANTQSQFGFQHVGWISGSAPDAQYATRQIQSSYATAIYFGDPVIKSASSPYISVALGTGNLTAIEGIFYGCEYIDTNGNYVFTPWWPGVAQRSDAKAKIINAPGALFKAAALLTAVPSSAIGQNIGFSTGAGGTTRGGGFSTYVVDQGTLTTGPTAPFQVYALLDASSAVGNGTDTTTSYNWVVVTFNNQRFRTTTGVA